MIPFSLLLCEPLVPLDARIAYEKAMRELCERSPIWCATWFGGVLANVVRSLPDADPWRHLSARLSERHCIGTPPAEGEGAWLPDGTPLRSWEAALDAVFKTFGNPEHDLGLFALTKALHPRAAALIAFAELGWEDSIQACRDLTSMKVHGDADFYSLASSALRWASHRRRSLLGVYAAEDSWPVDSAFRWIWRTQKIVGRLEWPFEEVESEIIQARVTEYFSRDEIF